MQVLYYSVLLIGCLTKSLDCQTDKQKAFNSRLNFFDIDLMRYSAEEKNGNIVVSPASVKAVLAMLLEGAVGETAFEIRNALRLSPHKDEYREQINFYLTSLRANSSSAYLENANAVFVSNSLRVNKQYNQMLHNVYLSEIFNMNFKNPEMATNIINSWVNSKTRGLIPTIVAPIQINPSIDILVVNALYFKSLWKHAFNPKFTKCSCFYVRGVCRKAPLMELQAELNYAYVEDLRAHAVELPYQDERYSMLILVPQDRDSSMELIRDLPYMSLPQILDLMDLNDVQLSLPRFTVDYNEDLVAALRKLRINSLFSTAANLSNIFDNEQSPQVNNVFHQTHIEVNEGGTVAAAATSAMVIPLINSGVQIKVDRSFVFFIRDNKNGATLFEGRIEEPEKIKTTAKGRKF